MTTMSSIVFVLALGALICTIYAFLKPERPGLAIAVLLLCIAVFIIAEPFK